ncbi:MAG: HEAT repeat domain-containing protein [Cyanobacteria bacterium J06642_9]
MAFIIGLIIGCLLAALLVYFWSQSQIVEKNEALQRSRTRIQQLEQEHNKRLQDATRQLQQDYDQRLTQGIADAQAQTQKTHHDEVSTLKARATASKAEVVTLKAEVTASHAEVMTLKTEIESLQHQVDSNRNAVITAAPVDAAIATPTPPSTDTGSPISAGAGAAQANPDDITPDDIASEVPVVSAAQSVPVVTTSATSLTLPAFSQMMREGTEPDSAKRQQIAVACKAVLKQPLRAETKKAMPLLAKLCQDSDPAVRLSAVEALAETRSRQVIPLLKRALRDSDMAVVAAASQAMDKFKVYPKAVATTKATKKKLPKNR